MIGLIAAILAQKNSFFNELIPSFTKRKRGVLAAILLEVFGAEGRNKHPTLRVQASALFILINTKRPFPSGNRRIALAVFFYLVAQEGKWLKVNTDKLYNLAHWISLAPADAGDEMIPYVEKFIKKYEVKMERRKGKKDE